MSTVLFILAIVALVLALIEEFRAQGRAMLAWAVVALTIIEVARRLPGR